MMLMLPDLQCSEEVSEVLHGQRSALSLGSRPSFAVPGTRLYWQGRCGEDAVPLHNQLGQSGVSLTPTLAAHASIATA